MNIGLRVITDYVNEGEGSPRHHDHGSEDEASPDGDERLLRPQRLFYFIIFYYLFSLIFRGALAQPLRPEA